MALTYRMARPSPARRRVRILLAACLDPQRRFNLGMAMAGLAAAMIVGAYAGLIPMGRWQVDEYRLFTLIRLWGVGDLPARLLYSPRPFSELLLFLYGEAVLHLNRPLVTSFLAVVWVGLIASTALAAFVALPRSAWRVPLAVAFTFALVAAALTGADATEAFYWPVAAAAYVPTLTAGLCLFFLVACPVSRRRRVMSGIALAVAACSSEVGAAFALCFALTMAAERLLAVLRRRARPAAALAGSAWWMIPGVLGALVFVAFFQLRSRYGVDAPGAGDARYGTQIADSLLDGIRDLMAELVAGSGPPHGRPLIAAITARALFVLGFAWSWRLASPARACLDRDRAALAAALLGAAFFSIAAAYQHYGQLCCERQQSVRQSFLTLDLLLLVLAALAIRRPASALSRRSTVAAPLILTAGILLPLLWRFEGLSNSYALFHWGIAARARTWASGLRSDTRGMVLYLPPDHLLPDGRQGLAVHGTSDPYRTYGNWPDAPNLVQDVGRFFGKRSVAVCQPWQTDRSWVIDGRFIPACVPPELLSGQFLQGQGRSCIDEQPCAGQQTRSGTTSTRSASSLP